MAVTIRQCNKPAKEQLAASVILTGASALRMIRAERRQMGYIGWKDLEPEEERRVLCTSSPSTEDIYLSDLVRIGAKISLSDRGKYLPPYTSPVANRLAKDKDQPADVGYFEVEPVLTPDRLADYLAACKGNVAKQLLRLCPYLSENLRSPMECIMLALFSLPFSYGGFACGPFKTDYKIEFDDRAQAISGMPHAVCDAYQEAARFDLEYNGELGHSSRRGRIHDEKRNTGLITMGIEVATVNNEMLCDMEAMEALAWRIHQRMRKRYRNRADARRKKQEALLNTLRACFGLKPV